MKFNELKQAMDWRRRVGFNGGGYVKKKVLPQPKPKEEAEKVNKERKEKNFEKIKGDLENPKEVKEMIDKPKRGLVDEPGSYAGKTYSLKEFIDLDSQPFSKTFFEKSISTKNKDFLKALKDAGITIVQEGKYKPIKLEVSNVKKSINKLINYASNLSQPPRKITQPFKDNVQVAYKQLLKTKKPFSIADIVRQIRSNLKDNPYQMKTPQLIENVKSELDKSQLKKLIKGGGGGSDKIKSEVDLLLKSKVIKDKLKANKFPTITDVSKVLKSDPTISETRLFDLADTLQDSNVSQKTKTLAQNYIDSQTSTFTRGGRKARDIYEKRLKNLLNLETTLPTIRRNILNKINKIIPGLEGLLNVDEVGSLTASMRRGAGPYAIFGQVLDSDFNKNVKGTSIDISKSKALKTINSLPINSPKRLEEIEKYNAKVDAFEADVNKDNPIKKVKGQKISLKPPSETIKNKKVYNQYKDLFDDHYKKYGYSFEVSADTDSIPDIAKKLDNKAFQNTVKNRFKTLLGKGGKFGTLIGAGTLAGTGFALADQPGVQEATSVLPTAAAAGTGAAAVGTKTGRSLLGKAFRTLGTPLSGLGFAATNVASKMGEGQSFADAVVDPLTGLELSFPGLFKENISKITRSPTLQKILGLGRVGRMLTPVGLGLAAAGQAQDFYNQYQNLQRMKRDDPEAYQQFRSTRVAPALSAAEQTAIEDMGRFGAAGGGIMKMAGKSSGRPPESGPTPQGLDFLLKRGR